MKLEKKTILSLLGMAFAVIFFAWAIYNWVSFTAGISMILRLFFPLVLGFCMAFVLNIPMRFFERHLFARTQLRILKAIRRPLCIVIALIVILTILTAVILLVVPEIINTFEVLTNAIPAFLQNAIDWVTVNVKAFPDLGKWLSTLQIDWGNTGKQLLGYVSNSASSLLTGTFQVVSGIVGGATNVMMGFMFALYILLSKEVLKRHFSAVCRALFSRKVCECLFFVSNLAKRTFASFVTGQCTEACILGSLVWLGMTLLRFPYAPMVAAMMGILALIPIIGGLIGLVMGAFMIMMVNPIQAIWFIIFILCLQQIEGNLIYPRVVGSSVGLPGIWVLAAVSVGGSLWGIVGMLFAVPLCSVLYALTRLLVYARLAEKGESATGDGAGEGFGELLSDIAGADAAAKTAANASAAAHKKQASDAGEDKGK